VEKNSLLLSRRSVSFRRLLGPCFVNSMRDCTYIYIHVSGLADPQYICKFSILLRKLNPCKSLFPCTYYGIHRTRRPTRTWLTILSGTWYNRTLYYSFEWSSFLETDIASDFLTLIENLKLDVLDLSAFFSSSGRMTFRSISVPWRRGFLPPSYDQGLRALFEHSHLATRMMG